MSHISRSIFEFLKKFYLDLEPISIVYLSSIDTLILHDNISQGILLYSKEFGFKNIGKSKIGTIQQLIPYGRTISVCKSQKTIGYLKSNFEIEILKNFIRKKEKSGNEIYGDYKDFDFCRMTFRSKFDIIEFKILNEEFMAVLTVDNLLYLVGYSGSCFEAKKTFHLLGQNKPGSCRLMVSTFSFDDSCCYLACSSHKIEDRSRHNLALYKLDKDFNIVLKISKSFQGGKEDPDSMINDIIFLHQENKKSMIMVTKQLKPNAGLEFYNIAQPSLSNSHQLVQFYYNYSFKFSTETKHGLTSIDSDGMMSVITTKSNPNKQRISVYETKENFSDLNKMKPTAKKSKGKNQIGNKNSPQKISLLNPSRAVKFNGHLGSESPMVRSCDGDNNLIMRVKDSHIVCSVARNRNVLGQKEQSDRSGQLYLSRNSKIFSTSDMIGSCRSGDKRLSIENINCSLFKKFDDCVIKGNMEDSGCYLDDSGSKVHFETVKSEFSIKNFGQVYKLNTGLENEPLLPVQNSTTRGFIFPTPRYNNKARSFLERDHMMKRKRDTTFYQDNQRDRLLYHQPDAQFQPWTPRDSVKNENNLGKNQLNFFEDEFSEEENTSRRSEDDSLLKDVEFLQETLDNNSSEKIYDKSDLDDYEDLSMNQVIKIDYNVADIDVELDCQKNSHFYKKMGRETSPICDISIQDRLRQAIDGSKSFKTPFEICKFQIF